MSDFVIQEHSTSMGIHWDLMIRQGEVLLTWQVDSPPELWGSEQLICRKIFDHRLKYLTYEGEITGNRGYVRIVAKGQYENKPDMNETGIFSDDISVRLKSEQLTGAISLTRLNDEQWAMTFCRGI